MAKGDILQALQQNPDMLKQILGNSSMQPQAQPTGNTQNFMAGQRKTMGDMNPVNPYGFVPPSMRESSMMQQRGMSDNTMRAPQMNMPGSNTGFMGNQNTGITGGMNKTYAPQPGMGTMNQGVQIPPAARMVNGSPTTIPQSPGNDFGMTQNNPYAPKNMMGQAGSRPY